MTKIIAFPPVGATQVQWFLRQPLQRSSGLLTGKRYVSALGAARIEATVAVSALARGRNGAGFSESLWRQIDGGVHLVSLFSPPANWHLDAQGEWGWGAPGGYRGLGTNPLQWTSAGASLPWTGGGASLVWFSGSLAAAVPGSDAAGAFVTVSGLPPNTLVIRPAEILRSYPSGDLEGVATRAITAAYSDDGGVAIIRLFAALPAGVVSLGGAERKVFEVTNEPLSNQPVGQNWTINWQFREVFPSEISDPVEVNPW
jgi:hypothetical protein